ncbi:MAG: nuclear transport factor 2 family protein [Enhydrobacter sp.]|nr:MAG: nuclear transport factor 2 family protein [Enhydrobacter sp.]
MSSVTAPSPRAPLRGWTVDTFKRFWARPSLDHLEGIDAILAPDIVGYWPRPIGKVEGIAAYTGIIEALLRTVPDLSLSVPDHAVSGNLSFVRWVAAGTGPDGRFEALGCDRVRVRDDGLVVENYIFCDHPFFAAVAGRAGRRPG